MPKAATQFAEAFPRKRFFVEMFTRDIALEDCITGSGFAWLRSVWRLRLAVPMGDRGCLSLFGNDPDQHRLLADHLTSEFRVKTQGRGRTVDEWKMRPERGDNHWFDCLVGCAVAASMQGAVLPGTSVAPVAKRSRVSFAELQRKRRD